MSAPYAYPSPSASLATFDFGNGLGVQINGTPYSLSENSQEHDSGFEERLARVKASGFDLVRVQIFQRTFDHPTLPDYDPANWNTLFNHALLDQFFATIAAAGLRACVSISNIRWEGIGPVNYVSENGFDASSRYTPFVGDPCADRYARFAGMIAHQAELNHPGNWLWECGNEPNLLTFAVPDPNLEGYLYTLWQFGKEIKARTKTVDRPEGAYVVGMSTSLAGTENPNGPVEVRRLTPSPVDWFRALARHPAAGVIDAVAPHPYTDNKLGDGGQTLGYIPNEDSPLRAVLDLEEIRRILSAPKYRTAKTPIAVVPTEWGFSMGFIPPRPLPSEIPAFTTTLGPTQRLPGAGDFNDSHWDRYQGGGSTGIVEASDPGRMPSLLMGTQRTGIGYFYGYHSHVYNRLNSAEATAAGFRTEIYEGLPREKWFGFAFEAKCDALDADGRGTRIWAGHEYSKTNFELTTEWKTYSGAYIPPNQGNQGGSEFDISTTLAGGGYHLRDVRVFDLPGTDVRGEGPRREAIQAQRVGEIGKAARAAECPAVFVYRWDDVNVQYNPGVENHYGLVRIDGSVKPSLPAIVRSWRADPAFDPSQLGAKLAAWYDAGFSLSRFKTAIGAEMANAGDPLGRLEDLSGNERHLVRWDNDARRPTLTAENGRIKAVFNGTSSLMRTAVGPYDLGAPFLIGAMSVPAGGGDYAQILGILASDGSIRFVVRNRTISRLQLLAARSGYTADADLNVTRGTALRVLAAANPLSGTIIDGKSFATTDPVPTGESNRVLVVGGNIDGNVTSAVHLGEMMLLDGTPDTATLDKIVSYLTRKWGL